MYVDNMDAFLFLILNRHKIYYPTLKSTYLNKVVSKLYLNLFSEGKMIVVERATHANFFETGYVLANRDLAEHIKRGGDPTTHFEEWGYAEGRQQLTRAFVETRHDLNQEKYRRFESVISSEKNYKFLEIEKAFPISFGTRHFDLSSYDSESANTTYHLFAEEIKQNPKKLYADIGAGFRSEVFDNCLYVEVYPSMTADILVEADCTYPLKSETLDGIGCFAVLEHVSHPWKVVDEMRRILKPGGKVYIDWPFLQPVHGYPSHYYNATREGLELMFSNGFEVQLCRTEANQTPAYTIQWILGKFLHDLPADIRGSIESLTVKELAAESPQGSFWQRILSSLPDKMMSEYACGNTLVAVKS